MSSPRRVTAPMPRLPDRPEAPVLGSARQRRSTFAHRRRALSSPRGGRPRRPPPLLLPEGHPQRHADGERGLLAPHDLCHHPRPLGQVDHGGDVRDAGAERRQVVAVDYGPGVERGVSARRLPDDVLAPAVRAELAGVVVCAPAGAAAAQQQLAPGGGVPVRAAEGVGFGEVETYGGRGHRKSPIASSRDQVCQDIAHSATNEMSAIIAFCPCSAQSWIISTR